MSENNMIECFVKKERQLFPKGRRDNTDGEYAIITFSVDRVVKGEPKIDKIYETILVKGIMPEIKYNKQYHLIAEETFDEKYKNYSYNVCYLGERVTDLDSLEDIRIVLEEITTSTSLVEKIMALDNVSDIFKNKDVEALSKVEGLGLKTSERLMDKFAEKTKFGTYEAKLGKLGLTKRAMDKLLETYPSYELIYKTIMNNPYVIAGEVTGIGFTRADILAQKVEMPQNSPERIKAFVGYYLKQKSNEGKSFVPTREVLDSLQSITDTTKYPIVRETIGGAFEEMRVKGKLWWNDNKSILALPEIRRVENCIANHIARLSNAKSRYDISNWELVVKTIEDKRGFEYTDEQREGIETVLKNNVVVVTGYGGTGKSSVLEPMTQILVNQQGKTLKQVALAGKAAQRIQDVTGKEAMTIHRALKFDAEEGGFTYNEKNPIDADIVILDEASMVDARLFSYLLEAIKTGSKLVIVGDHGQLNPIGFGQVLLDLIEAKLIPVVRLTKIHRQAQKSAIITESIRIRNNGHIVNYNEEIKTTLGELQDLDLEVYNDREGLEEKIIEAFKRRLEIEKDIMEVQVIVTTRTRGNLSAFNLNNKIKEMVNPIGEDDDYIESTIDAKHKYKITVGDKILVVKNNYSVLKYDEKKESYSKCSIFNGNMGIVKSIEIEHIMVDILGIGLVKIDKGDFSTIELGYATTCHKQQGSQYNSIIVAVDSGAYMMLSCEWLYTAITRAIKHCTLIGENKAIRRCCSTSEGNDKVTFLPYMLKEKFEK